MRTAEHFLLCRYFDYQQVTYHKTVAGMEWLLKDVLAALLETKMLECTAAWVKKAIASGEWFSFDETCVSEKIKQAASNTRDTTIRQKARALVERTTPKLLIEVEHIDRLSDKHFRFLQVSKQLVRERIPAWAKSTRSLNRLGISGNRESRRLRRLACRFPSPVRWSLSKAKSAIKPGKTGTDMISQFAFSTRGILVVPHHGEVFLPYERAGRSRHVRLQALRVTTRASHSTRGWSALRFGLRFPVWSGGKRPSDSVDIAGRSSGS